MFVDERLCFVVGGNSIMIDNEDQDPTSIVGEEAKQ